MAFDFKKEYKEFYMPKNKPGIVTVPSMNYIAVRGQGDPNTEDGEYKQSIGLLYGIAFTIKMSKKGDHQIDEYYDYIGRRWRAFGGRTVWTALITLISMSIWRARGMLWILRTSACIMKSISVMQGRSLPKS